MLRTSMHVVVEDCRTPYFGGGIKSTSPMPLLEGVVVPGFEAHAAGSSKGGGIAYG